MRTWRELETGPQQAAVSGWGPHAWDMLRPTAVHRDGSSLYCTLIGPIAGGPRGLEEEHVHGGSTPGQQWAVESERGPRNRCVLSPMGNSPG
jgi:hypothetical protein